MAPALPRTSLHGTRLVRLLADLGVAQVGDARPTFAERLGEWMAWTDAIALSGVLNGPDTASPAGSGRGTASPAGSGRGAASPAGAGRSAAAAALAEFQRVRRELAQAIVRDTAVPAPTAGQGDAAEPGEAGYAPYRRHYRAWQQAMDQRIGALRAQVRRALSGRSPALGQLAALDGVLDEALAERERHLLAKVPALLGQHFERLRQAAPSPPTASWQDAFCRDMQAVLLAELEVRLQPVEGMLEALGHEAPTQQGSDE